MAGAANHNELITSRVIDGVTVIGFSRGGMREEREILTILESLGRYIDGRGPLRILLDLGHLEYLTSAGLGHLVGLLKKSRAKGGILRLCCLGDSIRELFQITHLEEIFEIYPSVEEAVESFSPSYEAEASR